LEGVWQLGSIFTDDGEKDLQSFPIPAGAFWILSMKGSSLLFKEPYFIGPFQFYYGVSQSNLF
jgi:hypothetical protein